MGSALQQPGLVLLLQVPACCSHSHIELALPQALELCMLCFQRLLCLHHSGCSERGANILRNAAALPTTTSTCQEHAFYFLRRHHMHSTGASVGAREVCKGSHHVPAGFQLCSMLLLRLCSCGCLAVQLAAQLLALLRSRLTLLLQLHVCQHAALCL